jgi:tetrahydromethanopterin S-methyltransferase subunit E
MPIVKDGKTDLADRLRTTAEDLVELVTAQVKLVRLELLGDARTLGSKIAKLAFFIPLAVLGYGFLAAALAWVLAAPLGLGWALALVGAVHLAGGVWGVMRVSRSLGRVKVMERSREELRIPGLRPRPEPVAAATRPADL